MAQEVGELLGRRELDFSGLSYMVIEVIDFASVLQVWNLLVLLS
jgi:hypothetical protein